MSAQPGPGVCPELIRIQAQLGSVLERVDRARRTLGEAIRRKGALICVQEAHAAMREAHRALGAAMDDLAEVVP